MAHNDLAKKRQTLEECSQKIKEKDGIQFFQDILNYLKNVIKAPVSSYYNLETS